MALLAQHANVVWMSEYLTSQICSSCDRRSLTPLVVRGSESYTLRVCNHCHRVSRIILTVATAQLFHVVMMFSSGALLMQVWNRDCNAARNLMACLVQRMEGRGRPSSMTQSGRARRQNEAGLDNLHGAA